MIGIISFAWSLFLWKPPRNHEHIFLDKKGSLAFEILKLASETFCTVYV